MGPEFNAGMRAFTNLNLSRDCLECGFEIHQPLCPDCISRQFRAWVAQHPKIEKKALAHLKKFMKQHRKIKGEYYRCVCCGAKKVNVCPYCFTSFLHDLLKLEKASQKVIGEFLFLFNFDFEHNGYYQAGEDIGVF